ncbi:MAG: SDR family oxidoreductase [Candidatus Sumerlaeia bacterium]
MELGLKGRRALVLAASAGLGRGIAAALAGEGARVAIAARREEPLRRSAEQIGAVPLIGDLSRSGEGRRLVEAAAAALGGVDILVTNAGGPPRGAFEDLNTGHWLEGFQGLFLSAVEAVAAALPPMKERRWGRLLLVTSVAAREPIPGLTVSSALRAGLLALMKSLSRETAPFGVTVNALMPGYTQTERLAELGVGIEALAAQIPAGRLGRTEELGALAAFLASEQAAYITGQAIACDGGFLQGW